jgi:phosphoglycolate phosphatase-like HAD superfamily hydrolase
MVLVKLKNKIFGEAISPSRNIIKTKGKMYYKEDNQAWCLLRFRKEIIDEFNQLKDKDSRFSYDAIYYRTYEEVEKALKELKKAGQPLPLLMWFVKDIKVLT